jgi:hypothetical protein
MRKIFRFYFDVTIAVIYLTFVEVKIKLLYFFSAEWRMRLLAKALVRASGGAYKRALNAQRVKVRSNYKEDAGRDDLRKEELLDLTEEEWQKKWEHIEGMSSPYIDDEAIGLNVGVDEWDCYCGGGEVKIQHCAIKPKTYKIDLVELEKYIDKLKK